MTQTEIPTDGVIDNKLFFYFKITKINIIYPHYSGFQLIVPTSAPFPLLLTKTNTLIHTHAHTHTHHSTNATLMSLSKVISLFTFFKSLSQDH